MRKGISSPLCISAHAKCRDRLYYARKRRLAARDDVAVPVLQQEKHSQTASRGYAYQCRLSTVVVIVLVVVVVVVAVVVVVSRGHTPPRRLLRHPSRPMSEFERVL